MAQENLYCLGKMEEVTFLGITIFSKTCIHAICHDNVLAEKSHDL
jgi:hypothetical protein